MAAETIRCFIAVDVSEPVRAELEGLLASLKGCGADAKWVKAGNLHLTLKFLGEAAEEQVSQVKNFLRELCAKEGPFSVHYAGLGAFPDLRRPRVVWVGMDEGGDSLKSLAEKIEAGAAGTGFPKEDRAFLAHLTLGRVRSPRRIGALVKALGDTAFSSAHKNFVDHVTFYKSTLTAEGPIYEAMAMFGFGRGRKEGEE